MAPTSKSTYLWCIWD